MLKSEEENQQKIASSENYRLIEGLAKLSLSRLEARIYLHLLINQNSKASELAHSLNVNRIDVYRCLKNLRQRGIVELAISKPFIFSAVEPKVLKEVLLYEQDQELKIFRASVDKLEAKLEKLPRKQQSDTSSLLRSDEQFAIKSGYQIREKWQHMALNANSEVLIILSKIGLMTHSLEGFSEVYSNLKKKGVTVKMISDVVKENMEQANEFSKVCKFKVLSGVDESLRYVITDSSEAMVSMGSFSNNRRDFAAICTTKPIFVRSFRSDFLDKWRRAKPFPRADLL